MTNKEIDDTINKQLAKDGVGEFSVVQFFADGHYEYVARYVPVEDALSAAAHYTMNVSAYAGLTSKVIITDGGDDTVFEWRFGEGVVFPDNVVEPQRRNYSK